MVRTEAPATLAGIRESPDCWAGCVWRQLLWRCNATGHSNCPRIDDFEIDLYAIEPLRRVAKHFSRKTRVNSMSASSLNVPRPSRSPRRSESQFATCLL